MWPLPALNTKWVLNDFHCWCFPFLLSDWLPFRRVGILIIITLDICYEVYPFICIFVASEWLFQAGPYADLKAHQHQMSLFSKAKIRLCLGSVYKSGNAPDVYVYCDHIRLLARHMPQYCPFGICLDSIHWYTFNLIKSHCMHSLHLFCYGSQWRMYITV